MVGERERGTPVGEKFRILAKLGQGGMGTVYEGEHIELGHRVAIKVILPTEKSDEMVKRFQREAIVLGQLESDHVVRVFDCGVLPDGAPYLVMEFLKGMDLDAYVRTRGPIPVEEAAEIGISVCDALADAHSKGIVHRDIKPSNLFLVDRPGRRIIKVLDFGVSLLRRPGDESLTQAHAVLGTPLYAAPEQLTASKTADGRADLWSLGASLFELVTGQVPFPSATMSDLAMNLQKPARLASDVNKSVSLAFARVLAGCLERNLSERVASAHELRRALKPFRVLSRSSSVFGAALSDEDRAVLSGVIHALPSVAPDDAGPVETTDVNDAPFGAQQQQTPKMAPAPRVQHVAPLAATTVTTAPPRRSAWVVVAGIGALLVLAVSVGIWVLRVREAKKDAWTALASATTTASSSASALPLLPTLPLPSEVPTLVATNPVPTASASATATPLPSTKTTQAPKPPKTRPPGTPVPSAASTKGLLAPGER